MSNIHKSFVFYAFVQKHRVDIVSSDLKWKFETHIADMTDFAKFYYNEFGDFDWEFARLLVMWPVISGQRDRFENRRNDVVVKCWCWLRRHQWSRFTFSLVVGGLVVPAVLASPAAAAAATSLNADAYTKWWRRHAHLSQRQGRLKP